MDGFVTRGVNEEDVSATLIAQSVGTRLNLDVGIANFLHSSGAHILHQLVPVTNF
jgi:hypothetical protein